MTNTMILHDLPTRQAARALASFAGADVFCALQKSAFCTGCYGCWVKTPAQCVLHDGIENIGGRLVNSDRLIIISRNRYGGFDTPIKNVLDRSISGMLPYFTVRGGELHHQPRYEARPQLSVYFYDAGNMTPQEQQTARDIVAANGLNFNAESAEVFFADIAEQLGEMLA